MKIESFTSGLHRLPPASPWEDATNKVQALEFVVVDVTTDAGISGTGFSYSVDIGGTAIRTLIEDYLSNLAIGMNPLAYEQVWSRLSNQSSRLGLGVTSMAIAAIDVAIGRAQCRERTSQYVTNSAVDV